MENKKTIFCVKCLTVGYGTELTGTPNKPADGVGICSVCEKKEAENAVKRYLEMKKVMNSGRK